MPDFEQELVTLLAKFDSENKIILADLVSNLICDELPCDLLAAAASRKLHRSLSDEERFKLEILERVLKSSNVLVEGPVELPVIIIQSREYNPIKTVAEISNSGETNYHKFTAQDSGKYRIETEGRIDIIMTLYGPDSERRFIAQDEGSGKGLNAKIIADLTPGTYYIRIQHHDSERGTGAYMIKVCMEV